LRIALYLLNENDIGGKMTASNNCILVICFTLLIIMAVSPCVSASKVIAIDSRLYLSVALLDDGTVLAWGETDSGYFSSTPIILNITGVKAVSVSNGDIFFLKNDGTVWAMGGNLYGQLGIGTETSSSGIVQAIGLSDIINISAGTDHVLALKSDGTVWAWGHNRYGEIGNGDISHSQPYPVIVENLTHITGISAGYRMSVALADDGTIWTWGINDNGSKARPVHIAITDVKAVHAGQMGEVIAVKNDGTVWAWGSNYYGQRGNGQYGKNLYVPTQVGGISNAVTATTSVLVSFALKTDGTVWIWGDNQGGIFGNGMQYGSGSTKPVQISSLKNITDISLGWSHAMALSDNGVVWAWGDNTENQIGNDVSISYVLKPVVIIKGNLNDTTFVQPTQTYPDSPDINSNSTAMQNSGGNDLWLVGIVGIIIFMGLVVFINKIRKR
jgi:alpha-tubulin suppressor-like RCC1 family protein